jgi:hypothetical protein
MNERRQSMEGMTKDWQIRETITKQFLNKIFTIAQLHEKLPDINVNTIRTVVSRDLVNNGFVKKIYGEGSIKRTYQCIKRFTQGDLPMQTISEKINEKPVEDELSYSTIGQSIEALIMEKNQSIKNCKNQIEDLENQINELEKKVQERDTHIRNQGIKIYKLNEMLRKRSGGAIKLDELQKTVQDAINGNDKT